MPCCCTDPATNLTLVCGSLQAKQGPEAFNRQISDQSEAESLHYGMGTEGDKEASYQYSSDTSMPNQDGGLQWSIGGVPLQQQFRSAAWFQPLSASLETCHASMLPSSPLEQLLYERKSLSLHLHAHLHAYLWAHLLHTLMHSCTHISMQISWTCMQKFVPALFTPFVHGACISWGQTSTCRCMT